MPTPDKVKPRREIARAGSLAAFVGTDNTVKNQNRSVLSKATFGFQDVDPIAFEKQEAAKSEFAKDLLE